MKFWKTRTDKTAVDEKNLLDILKNKVIIRVFFGILTMILTLVLVFSLTIAWQTNVIQTSGLNFTAEKWNFSGTVDVDSKNIAIAPGKTGVIDLRISNDSTLIASVSVNVSKANLAQAMHKRLYFYIDTTSVRNGEEMDRVWLNSKSTYTYSMFPYTELAINESSKDAPLLNWVWVYDVLGYYVLGSATPTAEGDTYRMIEREFLSPIVYDYDMARTTFSDSGMLETIDGTTSAIEFIAQLSQTDGYEGTIDANDADLASMVEATGGYYPVDVDEKGYGVWAYLCTLPEIEQNIEYDTALGTGTETLSSLNASVVVTGCNSSAMTVAISDEAELLAAMISDSVAMVKLENDVTLSSTLTLEDGSSTWIDLNGHTLSGTDDTTVIKADSGSTLMIQNGVLSGNGDTTAAITASGAHVTLEKVIINDTIEGVFIRDNLSSDADSKVSIIACDFVCKEDGLLIYGNTTKSEDPTEVLIKDSNIVGETYTGIIFNGTYWGTKVDIVNSTVDGYYAGIYFPQSNSTLNITDSKIFGNTGIVIKGGTVNIDDTTIYARGPYTEITDLTMNGWTDTGDGIYLETNYGYDIEVNISGDCIVTSTVANTYALREYPLADNVVVNITGGSFSSSVASFLTEGYIEKESSIDDSLYYVVSEKEQVVAS